VLKESVIIPNHRKAIEHVIEQSCRHCVQSTGTRPYSCLLEFSIQAIVCNCTIQGQGKAEIISELMKWFYGKRQIIISISHIIISLSGQIVS